MLRLEGALPSESLGRVVPYVLGDLVCNVPGIPLRAEREAILAARCGIGATEVAVIPLAAPDIEPLLRQVPVPGVVQIDAEWMRYDAVHLSPPRLVITARGLGATTPASHAEGARVLFVEARPVYVLAAAPPGYSYPPGAVVTVRVNDSSVVPHYTVRLQDDRVPGHRLVTVEFDLTRPLRSASTPAPLAPPAPSVLSVTPIRGGSDEVDAVARARPPRARTIEVTRLRGVTPTAPPPRVPLPPTRVPESPRRPQAGGGARPAQEVRVWSAPLGRVTADLRGLRDTPGGRITGTPFGVIDRPAHVTRLVLEETYGQRGAARYHAPSWAATHARQVAQGLRWRVLWSGDAFEPFRAAAGFCGQADLYVDAEGLWRYVSRDAMPPPVMTLTPREIEDLQLSWVGPLATRLTVTWGQGEQAGALTLEDPYAQQRHGLIVRDLSLPYCATEADARRLGRYWLSQWSRPRLTALIRPTHAALALDRTDRIEIVWPLLDLYARRVTWQIRGTTDRGADRSLVAVEDNAAALASTLAARVVTSGQLAAMAYGRVQPAISATLYGSYEPPIARMLAAIQRQRDARRARGVASAEDAAALDAAPLDRRLRAGLLGAAAPPPPPVSEVAALIVWHRARTRPRPEDGSEGPAPARRRRAAAAWLLPPPALEGIDDEVLLLGGDT